MAYGYGIDMGTGNLKIFDKQSGTLVNEKNTIAIIDKDRMYAYGDEAYSMYEKAPDSIEVSFPIVNGVIADFDNMQTMLFEMLEQKMGAHLKGADIVIAVPTDITEVEKKAFYDLFAKSRVRARNILLCEKPLADAMGMNIDITEPTGVMVVDIGADTTEISVISLGGLVLSNLLPIGGNKIDESIVTHLKRKFNLVIGKKTAKALKETIGAALPGHKETMTVVGRDVVSGLPIEMEINASVVYEGMRDDLDNIGNNIKMILEKVPPELAKDIVNSGVYLSGGGSLITDLAEYFSSLTNIGMIVADRGDETVARGLDWVISNEKYRRFGNAMKSRLFS